MLVAAELPNVDWARGVPVVLAALRLAPHRGPPPVPAFVAAREQRGERDHAGDATRAFAPIGCPGGWHGKLAASPVVIVQYTRLPNGIAAEVGRCRAAAPAGTTGIPASRSPRSSPRSPNRQARRRAQRQSPPPAGSPGCGGRRHS